MTKDDDRIDSLPNLGPKSAELLRAAGIGSLAQLKRTGSVRAYAKVRAIDKRASLNLLWALEAALTGRPWREVAREDRLRLLLELEDSAKARRRRPRD